MMANALTSACDGAERISRALAVDGAHRLTNRVATPSITSAARR